MGLDKSSPETKSLTFADLGAISDIVFKSSETASPQQRIMRQLYDYDESFELVNRYLDRIGFLARYVNCSNLQMPVLITIANKTMLCASEKQICFYSLAFKVNIRTEIRARKEEKFSEPQIWYLFWNLVNAVRQFQPFKIKSGNLKTSSIFLNSDGRVKIANILTSPLHLNSDSDKQITSESIANNFYAPEQLQMMSCSSKISLNENIAQTYAIGVTLLELCTFIEGENIYDMKNNRIDKHNLDFALIKLHHSHYTKLLLNLIKVMLSSVDHRPLPSQLFATFRSHQKSILSLKPFKFDTSPSSIKSVFSA